MNALVAAIRRLVGNGKTATILIAVFIGILCLLAYRCHGAELDLRPGASFGPGGGGAVLGLDVKVPIQEGLQFYAGTLLWGATSEAANNWSWETGLRACRWHFCASLGASYLQRIDAINGAHTNYNLELSYQIDWYRLASIDITHLSDAGTTTVNKGRNAALADIRLQ